jgi:CheY-like chemotaxis protein/anti-sigma regulatory factor (Ser/Thr protein kinase)
MPATGAKQVLVVDDDRTISHLVATLLKREGFDVTVGNDGAQGLEQLRKRPFDLVLLDLWMPQMTGYELLAAAQQEGITAPVIMMTSDDTPASLLEGIRTQAYRYVTKPFQPRELIAIVHDAIESGKVLPIEVISAKPQWIEVEVPCQREAAERLYDFMLRLNSGVPEGTRETIAIAFRELLLNAVEWGGQLNPHSKVRVSYVHGDRMILYRISDPGPGFSFANLSHAAISNPDPLEHTRIRAEKGVRPGGFGILMTRNMVDELLYNERQNEVLFVKYLNHSAA